MANNLNCNDLQVVGNLFVNGVISQNNTQSTDIVKTNLPFVNLVSSSVNGGNISFGNIERTLFIGPYGNWSGGTPPGNTDYDIWIRPPSNGGQGIYYWNGYSWVRFI